ncbi:plasma kallikrein-like isoform X2 [Clavelina lepadiformis]|uniref:plasma kallikrein-like isoform X2 n=1 Tax=Clavelina lepadiformis TaxID=159417 RepID=UPI0040438906
MKLIGILYSLLLLLLLEASLSDAIAKQEYKTRQKRQISGICYRQESYYCQPFRYLSVQRICTRNVQYCCDPRYTLQNGVCILGNSGTCGGYPKNINQESGQLTSLNYPGLYPDNSNCVWEIRGPEGSTIDITVSVLSIENARYPCFFAGCTPICVDRLTITDGNENLVLCGTITTQRLFRSRANYVNIHFYTDPYTSIFSSYQGFQLSYAMRGITTTTTTTTIPSTPATTPPPRSLAIACLGELAYTDFLPQCTLRCEKGSVVRYNCGPGNQSPRSGCTCPADRPVSLREGCITEFDCTNSIERPTCFGGAVFSECLPACTLTCENYDSLPDYCQRSDRPCISGCGCPPSTPILDNGTCISLQSCKPKPQHTTITCGKQFYLPHPKIIGGERSVRGSWPWAIQIIKQTAGTTKFQCGGTLLCSHWVLTAAHCFQNRARLRLELSTFLYRLRIGKHERDLEGLIRNVIEQIPAEIHVHPNYRIATTSNDIALVKLKTPLKMTRTVRPACLPPQAANPSFSIWGPPVGAHCYVVGWGTSQKVGPSNAYLKEARLSVRIPALCEGIYPYYNRRISLCVGGRSRNDTCSGDSGGPLLCKHGDRWYVDGITSYGHRCGVVGQPAVYTQVTTFIDWVRSKIGQECGHPDTEWLQHDDGSNLT